ncbi:MAG: gamma-glutamylcyclotransferase family protein [Planctomycetota bacterium]
MTLRLVVYGTLRRGEPRAPFLGGAAFLGELRLPGFNLLDLGEYPGAVPGAGAIVGEAYELPGPALLSVLDDVEGARGNAPLFRRALVDALGAPAWIYLYARDAANAPRIPSGDWIHR